MRQFLPPVSEKKRPLWQILIAPMLLASLGLHALFLMIPVASSDEAVIPPPDPEQDNIAITRIPPDVPESPPADQSVSLSPAQVATARPTPSAQTPTASAQTPAASAQAPIQPPSQPVTQQPSQPSTVSRSPAPGPTHTDLPNLSTASDSRTVPTDQPAANPEQVVPPSPQVPVPEPTIPALAVAQQEDLLAYISGLNLAQERLEQLSAFVWQRYGYSERNTRASDYTENRSQWRAVIREATGLPNLTPTEYPLEEDLTVTLERRVCLRQVPGEVKVGAVINPDGSLQGDLIVLRSSGYSAFDQKALEAVDNYDLPAEDSIKAYTITVLTEVDYGDQDCLGADQLPSDTSAET